MPTVHPRLAGGDKSNSRQGQAINRVIIHWWGDPKTSTIGATIGTLTDPNRTASVHYIVDNNDIYPQVDVSRRAWTSGSFEADGTAVTFELNPRVSDATFESVTWQIAQLINQGVIPSNFSIYGHKDWAATACCGDWYPLLGNIKAGALAKVGAVTKPAPKPKTTMAPAPSGGVDYGTVSPLVGTLQRELNRLFPSYSHLAVDNSYGDATKAVVAEFQRRAQAEGNYAGAIDGNAGPLTFAALRKYGARL